MTSNPPAFEWIDGDPLMEAIAATIWDHCRTEGTSLIVDDPRNIAAVAAAVTRAAVPAVFPEPPSRAAVLLEAAEALGRMDYDTDSNDYGYDTYRDAWNGGVMDAAAVLRRVADEEQPAEAQQQPETEDRHRVAVGWPRIKGNCPACCRASLFLGTGGYPTCSNYECPEPDAATTVLEQYANEAHPPSHSWKVESPRRDNWASWGTTYDERNWALERYESALEHASTRPFRLVRETTTYTVEAEYTPPAPVEPAAADSEETRRCGCPTEDAVEHQFGTEDCTCIPFTRQTDPPRYLNRPTDTVDMISGWERGRDCPHHRPAAASS